MKATLLALPFFLALNMALGATTKDYQYKVESEKSSPAEKKKSDYPYDSLDDDKSMVAPQGYRYWTRDNRAIAGLGFHADKSFFNNKDWHRLFALAGLQFHQRSWHRLSAQGQWLQNKKLISGVSWEFTPSLEPIRTYYGLGISGVFDAEKEFRNFLQFKNFFLTGSIGMEYLLPSRYGILWELKGFIGTQSYALQIYVGYLIPI